MTMIEKMEHMQERSVAEFASDSARYIRGVHSTKEPLLITDAGEDAAVILDSHEFQNMTERLRMLEDVYRAQEQHREREGISHDEARARLLKKFPG